MVVPPVILHACCSSTTTYLRYHTITLIPVSEGRERTSNLAILIGGFFQPVAKDHVVCIWHYIRDTDLPQGLRSVHRLTVRSSIPSGVNIHSATQSIQVAIFVVRMNFTFCLRTKTFQGTPVNMPVNTG